MADAFTPPEQRYESAFDLYRDGKIVPLPPKLADTLLLLVRNRGRVVGKDEMMKELERVKEAIEVRPSGVPRRVVRDRVADHQAEQAGREHVEHRARVAQSPRRLAGIHERGAQQSTAPVRDEQCRAHPELDHAPRQPRDHPGPEPRPHHRGSDHRGEGEQVDFGPQLLQFFLMSDAETLLFIDDKQS